MTAGVLQDAGVLVAAFALLLVAAAVLLLVMRRQVSTLTAKVGNAEVTATAVAAQLKPNGGSSIRDAVDRIESTVLAVQATQAEMQTTQVEMQEAQDELRQELRQTRGWVAAMQRELAALGVRTDALEDIATDPHTGGPT
jgi:uncharacterized protein YhaN